MEDLRPEIDGANVVLRGSFNPTIFQPAWFGAHDIIRPEEAENAKVEVVHPEICSFAAEWLRIQVTTVRFLAESDDGAHHDFLPDLVTKVFTLLEHTPVTALGINRMMHFQVSDEERWHAIGDFLAPKDFWKEEMEGRPGLLSLSVQGSRNDNQLQVKVEPSTRVKPGVYIQINEHYPSSGQDALQQLLSTLVKECEAVQQHAYKVATRLLSNV